MAAGCSLTKNNLLSLSSEPRSHDQHQGKKARALSSPSLGSASQPATAVSGSTDLNQDKRSVASSFDFEGRNSLREQVPCLLQTGWEEVMSPTPAFRPQVALAPEDSLAVETWSLWKNESGKWESRSQGEAADLLTGCFCFCLWRRKRMESGQGTRRLASCKAWPG